MTLEGCVVRISDVIAYVGRDVEDAIRLNKIKKSDLPEKIVKVFGMTNSEIVNTIVIDIIKNSLGKNYITMSKEIYNALQTLIDFNYKNIYLKANSTEQLNKINKMFRQLFELYYEQVLNSKQKEDIYLLFLNNMCSEYLENTTPARKVLDYIAGMTDNFFIEQYDKYFYINK